MSPSEAVVKAMDLGGSKRKLLDDSDSDSESESDDGGVQLQSEDLKINKEYARRFEHNKKLEERQRLEEKFKAHGKGVRSADGVDGGGEHDDNESSSSSNETEDEDGFLATEDLDAQISATLQAIRNKDPRLYDKDHKFIEIPDGESNEKNKKTKPVLLRDYQREKLLRQVAGGSGAEDDGDSEDAAPQSYAQEQDTLKRNILSEINAAKDDDSSDDDSDDGGFMEKKVSANTDTAKNGLHPSGRSAIKVSELDVTNAEKDPETFLSNFMAARAWIPEEGGRWKAFESDEGEDDDRADEFEQAYNLRFEDPEKSNEVLKSYARDFAAARSVRREEKTGRQRRRELGKERKDEEKRQRSEEKARLRKLKLEETEAKLRKIKHAAGAAGKELTEADWLTFLDDAWDNDKWEEEMRKRFGDDYYALEDAQSGAEDGASSHNKKKKKHPSKPKWDDDIDINDLVPDFEDEVIPPPPSDSDAQPPKKRKTDHKRARLDSQHTARRERTKLEALVDSKMHLTSHDLLNTSTFRYRETSPQSFGMTARDILLAPSDKALNEFFGLKKLASFRDPEKKRRDKKRLGKKARLREWRRGTFGREYEKDGPTYGFEALLDEDDKATVKNKDGGAMAVGDDASGSRKTKKRKRSKGNKSNNVEVGLEDDAEGAS